MADGGWVGSFAAGTAANQPTVPNAPPGTFALYYQTDTGIVQSGVGGGTAWGGFTSTAQATPIAKTADATLTIAELLTRIITSTSASAVALTLPIGTLTDAGWMSGTAQNNLSFDWAVINLGSSSGAVTMTASTGHTYVGNATVAINTSARFRTRKTAAGVFVTYRIA